MALTRLLLTRRDALAQLAALVASPLPAWISGSGSRAGTAFAGGGPLGADPLDGTIADYQAGRRRGAWTAAEVTARALDRCRAEGRAGRAIDALADTALAEARAADVRLRAGRARGPLDGVPVFAKAIYDVAGLPTTGSNAEWARLFPDPVGRDALEVARLRAAGAVVLGKTAADDFAYRGNGTSSFTGQVLNPHDPTGTRTPGGSSAGSAVAVAGAMAFAALGTDDGGSNRIPAQFTGVVGMKPTFGLVPRAGVIPTWPYLDTHGPLARTVADAALLLAAVAGADASDPLARADVARVVGLTPGHLTTVGRRKTGRTGQQWIVERRMSEARRLLVTTDLGVEEVGRRAGYGDPGYFARIFRRTHGVTPRGWRRASRP